MRIRRAEDDGFRAKIEESETVYHVDIRRHVASLGSELGIGDVH